MTRQKPKPRLCDICERKPVVARTTGAEFLRRPWKNYKYTYFCRDCLRATRSLPTPGITFQMLTKSGKVKVKK